MCSVTVDGWRQSRSAWRARQMLGAPCCMVGTFSPAWWVIQPSMVGHSAQHGGYIQPKNSLSSPMATDPALFRT